LSLQLLLDEDSQAKYLVNLLRAVGHDVTTVSEVGLGGRPDANVLDYARQQAKVLLTRNCDYFEELHRAKPTHPGILVVYQNPDSSKNMSYQSIVAAISNLEAAGYALENQFVVLNQWNY
jgi:predicted nuclease of predicted toxin-antitoxin system